MFGMPQETVPESELREAEQAANLNVQLFGAACAVLWFSPHVVEWAYKLL